MEYNFNAKVKMNYVRSVRSQKRTHKCMTIVHYTTTIILNRSQAKLCQLDSAPFWLGLAIQIAIRQTPPCFLATARSVFAKQSSENYKWSAAQ